VQSQLGERVVALFGVALLKGKGLAQIAGEQQSRMLWPQRLKKRLLTAKLLEKRCQHGRGG
jgi:hypothetical protein